MKGPLRRAKHRHRGRPRSRGLRKRVRSRRRAVQRDCDGSLRRAVLAYVSARDGAAAHAAVISPADGRQLRTGRSRTARASRRHTAGDARESLDSQAKPAGETNFAQPKPISRNRCAQPIVLYKGIGFDRSPRPRRDAGRATCLCRPRSPPDDCRRAIPGRLPDAQTRHNRNFQPSAGPSYGGRGALASSDWLHCSCFPGALDAARGQMWSGCATGLSAG
jgi:hypothetical protein